MTQGVSSSSPQRTWHVFFSYHTRDTGDNITSFLYADLKRNGINTFLDRKKLNNGDNIFSQLMNAIEGCQIAIPVISKNYPFSIWCYIELVKIFQCQKQRRKKKEDLTILPIFYNVDPTKDVGEQKNKLAEEFERRKDDFEKEFEKVKSWEPLRKKMEEVNSWESWEALTEEMQGAKWDHWEQFNNEMEKMELWQRVMVMADNNLWKNALKQVADMEGDLFFYNSGNDTKRYPKIENEAKLIKKVAKKVSEIVHQPRFDTKYPVELGFHVQYIQHLLEDGKDDNGLEKIQFLWIYGTSGMGKTTIAHAIFDAMSPSFKGGSFLTMVNNRVPSQPNELVPLQNQLLSQVLKKKYRHIYDENSGKNIIKGHLSCIKVLIILDDVDDWNQLEKLAGESSWFGPGSLIIITTTNQDLIRTSDKKYEVKKMNSKDSLQLFSLWAFGQERLPEKYETLSNDVVKYADGLPLALKELGHSIRSQGEKGKQWEESKKTATKRILEKLIKTSFSRLYERDDQTIFLDISCFFIGDDRDEVINILQACDEDAEARTRLLANRCLLKTDEHKKLYMHNMIREMGKTIVFQESPEPGVRSRLWDNKDAIKVWKNLSGSHSVRGFQLDLSMDKEIQWDTNVFFKMHDLKFLRIYGSERSLSHDCNPNLIFEKLVWIWWEKFPFEYILNNFHMKNLVILDMQMSFIQVWNGTTKSFPNLKALNLSNSSRLTLLSNFSCAPKLEKLIVKNCENLIKVDESISFLSELVELDLSNCIKLQDLPFSSIDKLISLNKFVHG